MVQKNNILNRLLAVAFLIMILQTGCTTAVKKQSLSLIGTGTGLAEITDSNQIPDFKDDYDKTSLLYAIDNSRKYFEKVESYPDSFNSMGFTPEKQLETLRLFRDGYVSSKSPQELTDFIAKNFRVFQAIGKEHGGEVNFTGYGFPVFGKNVKRSSTLAYARDMNWKTSLYIGSLGLLVTPMRGIAADDRAFPPGGLAFVLIEEATNLNEEGQAGKSFFTLTHDSRSTTKTTDRVDVFLGIGKEALHKAENFNTSGKLYYLLKR